MKAGFDVVGLPVVAACGRQIGSVRDLVLDDDGRHVLGISFQRSRRRKRLRFLSLQDVQAILHDRVVIATDTPPTGAPPHADGSLAGKAAITTRGRYLGTIGDIYFDERTGAISAFEIVPSEDTRGRHLSRIIPARARVATADVMVIDHGP
jgi:uncharacterized protein YrrD